MSYTRGICKVIDFNLVLHEILVIGVIGKLILVIFPEFYVCKPLEEPTAVILELRVACFVFRK